jgi:hypothetical protein
MTRRFLLSLFAMTLAAAGARAGTISYTVNVDLPAIPGPGFIDFQFNQANASTSLPAVASISGFTSTGFVFDDLTSGGTAGVTGSLASPPISIPNDAGAANWFDIGVTTWGNQFSFVVTLAGDAIGGASTDGSGFYLFLLDGGYNPILGSLPSGEIANALVNPDGSTTALGSTFEGGAADLSETPEPGALLLTAGGLGLLAFLRRSSPRK